MDVVFSIAHRISVLHQGRLIARARRRTSAMTPSAAGVYLGEPGSSPGARGAAPRRTRIETAYGLSRVLFGVSIDVRAGECVCLLGRNGVERRPPCEASWGSRPAAPARVVVKGADHHGWPSYRVARAGIGFVPRNRQISPTSRCGRISTCEPRGERHDLGPLDHRARVDLFPKLAELTSRNGGFLSGGEQQMLTIAAEALNWATPSSCPRRAVEGLAPLVVDHLQEQIERLKSRGLTSCSPSRGRLSRSPPAGRVYVLEKGSIRFSGAASELRGNEALAHELLAL